MKIQIDIDCDNINELWVHLRVLAEEVKKECKSRKLDPMEDEFPKGTSIEDNNCYGTHTLLVIETEEAEPIIMPNIPLSKPSVSPNL